MIKHIDVSGIGSFRPDEIIVKYIKRKVGALDRLIPRHARRSVYATAKVAQIDEPHGNKYSVEVLLKLPGRSVTAKDSTMNAMAATDIVETKLANQLRKYKAEKVTHIGSRRLLERFKHSFARES